MVCQSGRPSTALQNKKRLPWHKYHKKTKAINLIWNEDPISFKLFESQKTRLRAIRSRRNWGKRQHRVVFGFSAKKHVRLPSKPKSARTRKQLTRFEINLKWIWSYLKLFKASLRAIESRRKWGKRQHVVVLRSQLRNIWGYPQTRKVRERDSISLDSRFRDSGLYRTKRMESRLRSPEIWSGLGSQVSLSLSLARKPHTHWKNWLVIIRWL